MSVSRFPALATLAGVLLLGSAVGLGVEVQQRDSVKYATGGVGDEERRALDAMSNQFNLKMTLALTSGHFLGDANVHIAAADGHTVLDTMSDGPLFYVHLQPGTYTVKVSLNGKELVKTAHVGEASQQMTFTWKEE